MKKFTAYIDNGRYAVGTTGRTVIVFDAAGKETAAFRDLNYAYYAAFTPSGDKLIVKSTEGMLALYSLTELKLLKKLRFGKAPQDGGFCFSHDGSRFLNIALHEDPRRYSVNIYNADDLDELGTLFYSESCGIHDIECGDDGVYYVLGKDENEFAGIIADGELVRKKKLTFEQFALYADALRLRRTGYTEECYKSSFAATGVFPNSFTLDEFKQADLTLKKLFDDPQTAEQHKDVIE